MAKSTFLFYRFFTICSPFIHEHIRELKISLRTVHDSRKVLNFSQNTRKVLNFGQKYFSIHSFLCLFFPFHTRNIRKHIIPLRIVRGSRIIINFSQNTRKVLNFGQTYFSIHSFLCHFSPFIHEHIRELNISVRTVHGSRKVINFSPKIKKYQKSTKL